MADLKALEDRLKEVGCNYRFWGRAEIRELADVLLPNEVVELCTNGRYEGGFALLVATDQRVLLIDKKPMYLTLEDIRYDMIAEVDYNHRLMDANIFICTPSKSLRFMAYNNVRLRKMFHYIQQRVMDVRQHYQRMQEYEQQYMAQGFEPYLNQLSQAADSAQKSSVDQADSPQRPRYAHPMARHAVAPIISAYTRLPMLSRQRRFLGSRAMNTPMPSIYHQ